MHKTILQETKNLIASISKIIPIEFEHFIYYDNILTESYINIELNLWMEKTYKIKNRKLTNEKIVYFINNSNARVYSSLPALLKNNKAILNKSIKLYNI